MVNTFRSDEIEKEIDVYPFPGKIKIGPEGKIYSLTGAQFPKQEQYVNVIVIYNQNGKIIDRHTIEEIGDAYIYRLNVDNDGNIRFIIAENLTKGKESPPYGVEISPNRKIKKIDLTKVDNKIKTEKFKYGLWVGIERKFQNFSTFSHGLVELIKKSRDEMDGGNKEFAEDDEGNIYEIIWRVPHHCYDEAKGITKIVWDNQTLPEGVKIIKWKKVK